MNTSTGIFSLLLLLLLLLRITVMKNKGTLQYIVLSKVLLKSSILLSSVM